MINILLRDGESKGEGLKDRVKIWKYNIWTGPFYPVFTFYFAPNNQCVKITDKLNTGAITLFIFIAAIVGYLLNFKDLVANFQNIPVWYFLFLGLFCLCGILIFRAIYASEKRNQLEDIYKALHIPFQKKTAQHEWSIKRVLLRLFTYPFSVFLFLFSLWHLFNDGFHFYALAGLVFSGVYLYTDIYMMVKNSKK